MEPQKRICVIGAGKWGLNHIKTLAGMSALAGIVESDPSRLSQTLEKYPAVKGYSSIEEALADGFDGYVVATPAGTHFSIGGALLQKKQHVLIEKPMALSSEHTQILNDLARKNQCRLMVGHVLLFHPAIRKIKEMIDAGKIGKLDYLYSNRLNLGTVRTEENVFWSFAPHDISIFDFFIGKAALGICASGGAFLQDKIEDVTIAALTYPDNIKAHIFVSWLHPFKEQRLVVIGSQGMLSFEDSSAEKQILYYNKGVNWVNGAPVLKDNPPLVIEYQKCQPLENELRYFIENLDGGMITIADGQSGHNVVKVLEQVAKHLENNC